MHAIEHILAQHADRELVTAGDTITVDVDLGGVNDLYPQVLDAFLEMGGKSVWNRKKVAFFFDHYAPPSTIKAAQSQQAMRKFAVEQGIEKLFDIDQGVCHPTLWQSGLVAPGMVVVVTDSHSTTYGAFGAFGTGVGATDMAAILLSGKIWLRVPEVILIQIVGRLSGGVMAKDVILKILGTVRADGAVYQAVEFSGEAVTRMSTDQRAVLANMAVEMGAKTSFIPVDALLEEEVRQLRRASYTVPVTDRDYEYADQFVFDISRLEPQVALPGAVDDVVDVASVLGARIDQAYVGGCTGGLYEDLAAVARQLRGRAVRKGVRLIVSPATRAIYLRALSAGYISVIVRAGGTVTNPGCGPCLGIHQGILAPGEACISSASRNFPGRMGSREAQVFLASPATAAASAVEGGIALPKEGAT